MKPSEFELRQLKREDLRLSVFKEKNFEQCGHDGGNQVWIKVLLASIIGMLILIAFFTFIMLRFFA
jgi:hypothetical protein